MITLRKLDNSNYIVIVQANNTETINEATSTTIATLHETLTLMSNGISQWFITNRYIPSIWTTFSIDLRAPTTNPTLSTNPIMNNARWRRVGGYMEIIWEYGHGISTGTAGSGIYYFMYPVSSAGPGYLLDNGRAFGVTNAWVTYVGTAQLSRDGYFAQGSIYAPTTNYFEMNIISATNSAATSSTWGSSSTIPLSQPNTLISINVKVPILNWSD
jgi:hypothetical protein